LSDCVRSTPYSLSLDEVDVLRRFYATGLIAPAAKVKRFDESVKSTKQFAHGLEASWVPHLLTVIPNSGRRNVEVHARLDDVHIDEDRALAEPIS
jgi:hypothetical protein